MTALKSPVKDQKSKSPKYKAVIIGYGGIGHSWHNAIKQHPDWELIGIVDENTELLENCKNFGLEEEQGYMSIEDAVQFGEKPDLAIIGTPIYSHHSLAQEVLNLGINCICEKNMASNIYQGRQMVQKAIDNPTLCTATGTQYRYEVKSWTAKKFFEEKPNPIGTLGSISWISSDYRGERRWGWRRFLPDVYLEDMSVHWFDTIRYVTQMDIVEIKATAFMPRYSDWNGSSELFAQFALANPDDYNHRHNWVWVQMYGGWQRRGPTSNAFDFFGSHGQARMTEGFGMELKLYTDMNDTRKFEEDGYLPVSDVENLGTNFTGQSIILEQMALGIESKGKRQPGTNFCQAFKSFAVAMGASESSRTGKTVWIPDYWKDLPELANNPSKFY
jgi:predicted dehydrogenase